MPSQSLADLIKEHKPPFRPTKKMAVVAVVWAAFLVWVGFCAVRDASIAIGAVGQPWERPAARSLLYVDLWAAFGALMLAYVGWNPNRWRNLLRLTVGTTAAAMMIGRIGGNAFASFAPVLGMSDLVQFFLVPFALAVGGGSVVVALGFIAGLLIGVFFIVPIMMFQVILSFDRSISSAGMSAEGVSKRIVALVYWLRDEEPPLALPDESKGARLATDQEVMSAIKVADPKSMNFGLYKIQDRTIPRKEAYVLLNTEKHVLIMGSTRSGKGVALIIPHLLIYPGSAFVLDPKGENAKATGKFRAQLNQEVHYLDPFGITGKPQSRFNPLARFTPDNMEAESKALASAMFIVNERERDGHFTAAGQQLLAALILYVYAEPRIPRDKKDLVTVRKLLLGNIVPTLEAMRETDFADGLLRDLGSSFLSTPERERGSIISTAQRQTEILDNPYIAACVAASGPGKELDFAAWHRGTMTVYLSLSAPKFPTFNRWLRLVLTSALDEMTDQLNPPPLPVCFMLDELATLGHLQPVENAIGLAAGYGIQLVTVFQDVAQMKDLYKSRWASFIGNSGIRAVFNLDDYDTALYWSKFIGGALFQSRATKEDEHGKGVGGAQVSETMRSLLSPDALMNLFAEARMLILVQGMHPFVTGRVPYYEMKELAGRWEDPRKPVQRRPLPRPAAVLSAPAAAVQAAPVRPSPAPQPAARPAIAPVASPVAAVPAAAPAVAPVQWGNGTGLYGNATAKAAAPPRREPAPPAASAPIIVAKPPFPAPSTPAMQEYLAKRAEVVVLVKELREAARQVRQAGPNATQEERDFIDEMMPEMLENVRYVRQLKAAAMGQAAAPVELDQDIADKLAALRAVIDRTEASARKRRQNGS